MSISVNDQGDDTMTKTTVTDEGAILMTGELPSAPVQVFELSSGSPEANGNIAPDAEREVAEKMEREDREIGEADARDTETERSTDLWDAGAEARYQDEQRQLARDDEARAAS